MLFIFQMLGDFQEIFLLLISTLITLVSDTVPLDSSEVVKFIQECPQKGTALTFSPYGTHLVPFLQYQIHFVVKREPGGCVTDEGVEIRRTGLKSQIIFWKLML